MAFYQPPTDVSVSRNSTNTAAHILDLSCHGYHKRHSGVSRVVIIISVMASLSLGTKTTWLGLGKYHDFS